MIYKLVLFALALTLMIILLKENFKPGALILSAAGCICLFYICINVLGVVKDAMGSLEKADGVDKDSISLIIKTLSVAYVTSFGTDICNDAGEKAVGSALEAAGKMVMLSMALPMLVGIFSSVAEIIG